MCGSLSTLLNPQRALADKIGGPFGDIISPERLIQRSTGLQTNLAKIGETKERKQQQAAIARTPQQRTRSPLIRKPSEAGTKSLLGE